MIKKLCSYHGCKKVVEVYQPYCDYHQKKYEEEQKAKYKKYKLKREDKKEQAFYNSPEWKRVKEAVKATQNGMDIFSYYILNKVEEADTYHHIIEVKEDWNMRLEIENLIGLTYDNHLKIHKLYSKSDRDKKQLQRLLFDLLERYYKEFGG